MTYMTYETNLSSYLHPNAADTKSQDDIIIIYIDDILTWMLTV